MDNVIRAFQKLKEFYKLKINPQWKDAQMESVKGQIRNKLSTLGLWFKFNDTQTQQKGKYKHRIKETERNRMRRKKCLKWFTLCLILFN